MDIRIGDYVKVNSDYYLKILSQQVGEVIYIDSNKTIGVHFSQLKDKYIAQLHSCNGIDPSYRSRWFYRNEIEVINSILSELI